MIMIIMFDSYHKNANDNGSDNNSDNSSGTNSDRDNDNNNLSRLRLHGEGHTLRLVHSLWSIIS